MIRNHQKDITKTLVQVLEILTRSWRFPEKAIGELKFGQYDLCTEELPENSVWQGSEIKVLNSESGYLRVHYSAPKLNSRYFLDDGYSGNAAPPNLPLGKPLQLLLI